MRKVLSAVVILGLTVAAVSPVSAASLAGVTLPDTVQVGGTTLALNGLGLRTKFTVKVYVAGLYLAQKSSDADAILKSDGAKRIVMHFLHSASKSQMTDAFDESFHDNTPEAQKTMKAEIDRMLGALKAVKPGDQMVFTYVPGTGTTLSVNGTDKVTIAGVEFERVLLSVWLGPKPPNAGLKKGLLGQ